MGGKRGKCKHTINNKGIIIQKLAKNLNVYSTQNMRLRKLFNTIACILGLPR